MSTLDIGYFVEMRRGVRLYLHHKGCTDVRKSSEVATVGYLDSAKDCPTCMKPFDRKMAGLQVLAVVKAHEARISGRKTKIPH